MAARRGRLKSKSPPAAATTIPAWRATDGTLWLAYDRDGDIWCRTSAAATPGWRRNHSPLTVLATMIQWSSRQPMASYGSCGNPVVLNTTPSGIRPARTTASPGQPIPSSELRELAPAAAAMPDGRVMVVWQTYNGLRQRSSADGGATWSEERQITDWGAPGPLAAGPGPCGWSMRGRAISGIAPA